MNNRPIPRTTDPAQLARNRASLIIQERAEHLLEAAVGDPLAAALLDTPSCGCDLLCPHGAQQAPAHTLADRAETEVLRLQELTGRARDPAAATFLADPEVRGFLRARVAWFRGPEVDSDELFQVAQAALWRAVTEWRPDGGRSFLSFARFGIRNALERHLSASRPVKTKSRVFSVAIDDADEQKADDDNPEDAVARAERVVRLRTAISRLPAEQREVLKRRLAGERVRDVGRKAWEAAAAALRREMRKLGSGA